MTTSPPHTATVVVLPSVDGLGGVADEFLLDLQRQAGAARRRVDAVTAAIAGEIARRSDRSLGHAGLAARTGAATPEKAVQVLTGVSLTDARALTAVGLALSGGSPWLAPVEQGVADGSLSVASAAAITNGLGSPNAHVAADDLLTAAAGLVDLAQHSSPESTAKAARSVRELLDVATIADLEAHRRNRRSLTWAENADGMTRMVALLDPESAAIITGAIESVLSPRRGGPRFVDSAAIAAESSPDAGQVPANPSAAVDSRSIPQLAVDTLVEIVNLATRASGSDVDPAQLFGDRSPAVRVHVQLDALQTGGRDSSGRDYSDSGSSGGAAYFEGQSGLVSSTTADRHACTSGIIPVLFAGTRAIDVGATQRLHSVRQRVALAAQWNGCAWHDCDRPPAMTEVHHLDPFNGHNTTLQNGVPLCRFHHMELHANHWRIRRDTDGNYWLHPPGVRRSARESGPGNGSRPSGDQGSVRPPIKLRTRNPLISAA